MKNSLNRRMFLKATGAGAVSLSLSGCTESKRMAFGQQADKRPNILVIHADQHRIDCLGAYGNADVKTPNIDALAADGVRFNNSFCCFPVCTPSRYSLLSGMYVHDHGGWTNHCGIPPEIATFPGVLRAAGYRTAAVGKMHFTPTYLDVGFDEMHLAEQDGPGRWDDDYHRYLMKRDLVDRNDLEDQRSEYRKNAPDEYWQTFGAMVSNLAEKHHPTTWTADRAIANLKTWNGGAPNLLMVGFIKPHHPFDPPAPWHKMYDPQALSLLPGWRNECFDHDLNMSRGYFPHADLSESALRRVMAYYYATISQIDHHVGRMVRLLKQKGLYDNTLIVFTSDHGDYMGHHHMLLKGNYLYDPLAKVPLIVKYPHGREAGQTTDRLVNNIDLAPTLCRAAGCTPAATMQGKDLAADTAGHDIIFAEYGSRQVMARTKTHKLILAAPKANLFFDLENDPHEMTNLYEDPACAPAIAVLEARLTAWRHKGPVPKPLTEGPRIAGPNVPPADESHRPAIIAYYEKKMAQLRQKTK